MDTHRKILQDILSKNFPDYIDHANFPQIDIFKELYEQGFVKAIDASSVDGDCYSDPRITMAGRKFLAEAEKNSITSPPVQSFTIGSISGGLIQLGNDNTATVNISIQEIVEKVVKSGDPEAKHKLKEFLNNATVASIIGSGVQALTSLL